ncbi:DUF29 family protein [Pseudanabaena galeata UHCC 0370]|uniref:DUF29 family protein n=1 Tax=Pseudanabaena galeata UHCC 0370 TaxID=3110310 RepID=A0ABU5TJL7_9CYAN|nr:DUF29 family protein [Pseudanabaena galeata]MEA5478287.1 DUF29 family protein [Pseudanabaena galeata UHCC 0370]
MTVLYEQDYALRAEPMADLLLAGRFAELDIDNLVEKVRDLSKRERDRLLSSVRLILHHFSNGTINQNGDRGVGK